MSSQESTQSPFTSSRAGFSLIEIFAALVIIGFLVTVIISGNALIAASKLRSVSVQFEQYREAVEVFRSIHRSWPGDMVDASDYWEECHTNPDRCNGNGDEVIDATGNDVEQFMAWRHLVLSQMITANLYSGDDSPLEVGRSLPSSAVAEAGYWLLQTDNIFGKQDNAIVLGRISGSYDKMGGALKAQEAEALDIKIDDGLPDKGEVFIGRGFGLSSGSCTDKAVTQTTPVIMQTEDESASCAVYYWLTNLDS